MPEGLDERVNPEEMTTDEQRANSAREQEITPEIEAVLGAKRKELESRNRLDFRAMNINEYVGLMTGTTSSRCQSFVCQDYPEQQHSDLKSMFGSIEHGYGPVWPHSDMPLSPGEMWEEIINHKIGGWDGVNAASDQAAILREYRRIARQSQDRETARITFIDYLKDQMRQTMISYENRSFNGVTNRKMKALGRSNQEPSEGLIRPETISIIRELLEKPSQDFSSDDIRQLMLHIRLTKDSEVVSYQVLTIWKSTEKVNVDWSRVSKNPQDILAVLPIIDNDALMQQLISQSRATAEIDPSFAHLVLDIYGKEVFPEAENSFIDSRGENFSGYNPH